MTTIDVEGPCGTWPLDTDACPDFADLEPVTGRAANYAVNILYRLTGRRFGTCEAQVRPCAIDSYRYLSTYNSGGAFPSALSPHIYDNALIAPISSSSLPILACADCTAKSRTTLDFPFRVNELTDVTIGSESIPLSEFAILDHRTIVWRSPTGRKFPTDNDPNATLGNDDTWSVTARTGTPPPADTATILGIFACEVAKSMANVKCRLPRPVTSLQRQGVTYQFVEEEYLSRGLVGLTEVDQWIVSVNPSRLHEPPRVYSPDRTHTPFRRETWVGS